MRTMSERYSADNPFDDPDPYNEGLLDADSTLLLADNASLTLGADSLIVLGTISRPLHGHCPSKALTGM